MSRKPFDVANVKILERAMFESSYKTMLKIPSFSRNFIEIYLLGASSPFNQYQTKNFKSEYYLGVSGLFVAVAPNKFRLFGAAVDAGGISHSVDGFDN